MINADTGQLKEMNSKGSELFGYSREETGKLDGKDLIPVRDQPLYPIMPLPEMTVCKSFWKWFTKAVADSMK